MSILECHIRPTVMFDVSDQQHRKWASEFFRIQSWATCPVKFAISGNATRHGLVATIRLELAKYHSDIEFPQALKLNTKVVLSSGENQQNSVVKKQRIGKKA